MADKYIPRSKALYDAEIAKAMTEKFGYKNVMEVPKIDKITLNMGVGEATQDKKKVTQAAEEMELIAGQKPVITKAKKSIAQFKLREGMPIGAKVTLRRERIIFPEISYDRVDKVRGMDIIVTTTAKTDDEARELLRLFGFPFPLEEKQAA